jgi:hypothetical protein
MADGWLGELAFEAEARYDHRNAFLLDPSRGESAICSWPKATYQAAREYDVLGHVVSRCCPMEKTRWFNDELDAARRALRGESSASMLARDEAAKSKAAPKNVGAKK